jgi:hypothetical protein
MLVFPTIVRRRSCLAATAVPAVLAAALFYMARADDLVTPLIASYLQAQWADAANYPYCIQALNQLGDPKTASGALQTLLKGQPDAVKRDDYARAYKVLGTDRFWSLVAGSHTGAADCAAAQELMITGFATAAQRRSFFTADDAYRTRGNYAGLAALLSGADAYGRNVYRACYDVSPAELFRALEETLRPQP